MRRWFRPEAPAPPSDWRGGTTRLGRVMERPRPVQDKGPSRRWASIGLGLGSRPGPPSPQWGRRRRLAPAWSWGRGAERWHLGRWQRSGLPVLCEDNDIRGDQASFTHARSDAPLTMDELAPRLLPTLFCSILFLLCLPLLLPLCTSCSSSLTVTPHL